MVNANSLKKGSVIKLNSRLYSVVEHKHVKPGKGAAFVRIKLKMLKKDTLIEKTFRPDEKLEDVYIQRKPFQYLYRDNDDNLVFMDSKTYEQDSIEKNNVLDVIPFLKEGMELEADLFEGRIINVVLPIFVSMEVVHTEPALKGDTVGGATKPARIETGYTLNVPLFVNIGDILKIDTRTGEYITRIGK